MATTANKKPRLPERKSTEPGFPIADGQTKLRFFYAGGINVDGKRLECVHRLPVSSRRAFAKLMGLTDSQLKGTSQGGDVFSLATIEALCSYLGIDPSWPEWRTGPAAAFAKKYNECNTYQGHTYQCIREHQPVAPDPQLASLALRSTKNSATLPWALSLDLTCDVSPERDLNIWIRSAQIVFNVGPSTVLPPVAHRKKYPRDYSDDERSDRVTIDPVAGNQISIWTLRVHAGVLGSLSLPDFIQIENLAQVEEIEVSIRVYTKDLETDIDASPLPKEDKPVRRADFQSISWNAPARTTISAAKKRIYQRMITLAIQERMANLFGLPPPSAPEPIYTILARDQMVLRRVEATMAAWETRLP